MRITLRHLMLSAALLAVAFVAGWWLFLHEPGYKPGYPITNARPGSKVIVALGDSLTTGYGAPPSEGWVDVVSQRLGVPIINAGVNGSTTDHGLWRLERDVLAHRPGIVILGLGGNDLLAETTIDHTFNNLEQMIDRIQGQGGLVVLVGVSSPVHRHYGERYAQLARRKGCPFVPDVVGGIMLRPDMMFDPVHPNAKGYRKIARRIEHVLREYL